MEMTEQNKDAPTQTVGGPFHCEGCWKKRTHHECALVHIKALEIKVEAREKRVAELQAALADERKRREDAEALLVELIAVADENDALMMERLYGKPHGVEHKARTLDHMQRKSEAWRNARVYLTRYKD